MARKQSLADQAKRLDEVCCPVHGIPMYQEASGLDGVKFSVAGCTRGDCGIMAVVDHFDREDGKVEFSVRQLDHLGRTRPTASIVVGHLQQSSGRSA